MKVLCYTLIKISTGLITYYELNGLYIKHDLALIKKLHRIKQ